MSGRYPGLETRSTGTQKQCGDLPPLTLVGTKDPLLTHETSSTHEQLQWLDRSPSVLSSGPNTDWAQGRGLLKRHPLTRPSTLPRPPTTPFDPRLLKRLSNLDLFL